MSNEFNNVFFVRHTADWLEETGDEKILENNEIAIYFEDKGWNHKDYDSGETDVRYFCNLNENGGLVLAEYGLGEDKFLLGEIEPGSGDIRPSENSEDVEKLKYFQFKKDPVKIPRKIQPSLVTGRPRQGTCRKCKKIRDKIVEYYMKKKAGDCVWIREKLEQLSTPEQEVMCAEFLREDNTELSLEFPRLAFACMPIGRTMKDVDIYGITTNDEYILGQVTFDEHGSSEVEGKISKLKEYNSDNETELVMFCRMNENWIKREDGIWVVSLNYVLEKMKPLLGGMLKLEL